MKTKAIIAVFVALILVSSIASASFMGNIATALFNKVPTASSAAANAPATPQKCTANADCGTGTCTSCKCTGLQAAAPSVSLPAKTSTVTAAPATSSVSIPTKTPTITASTPTQTASLPTQSTATSSKTGILISALTGKALNIQNIQLPAAKTEAANTEKASETATGSSTASSGTARALTAPASSSKPVSVCMSECKAKCRTDCETSAATGSAPARGASASTAIKTIASSTPTTATKTSLTLSSGLKLSTGAAITLSSIKPSTGTGTLTDSTGTAAITNQANGVACTSASNCASGYCKTITATATAAVTKQCAACTANSQCGTGKVCSSGKCVAQALKANGATCSANSQCISNYCNMLTKVCAEAPAATNIGDCISRCEASCETTCGKGIAAGEKCNNPSHCENQCASGSYECFCEGTAVKAGQEKSVAVEIQAQQAIPAANLNVLESKIQALERKAVADGILTQAEVDAQMQGYADATDAEKVELLKTRFDNVLTALETKASLPAEEANAAREAAGVRKGQKAAKDVKPTPPPASAGFLSKLKFAFTGKVAFTGYALAPTNTVMQVFKNTDAASASKTDSSTATTPRNLTTTERTSYKATLDRMHSELTALETKICTKIKTLNMNQGPTCTKNSDCGTSGLLTCKTAGAAKYCTFESKSLCPEETLLEGTLAQPPTPLAANANLRLNSNIAIKPNLLGGRIA